MARVDGEPLNDEALSDEAPLNAVELVSDDYTFVDAADAAGGEQTLAALAVPSAGLTVRPQRTHVLTATWPRPRWWARCARRRWRGCCARGSGARRGALRGVSRPAAVCAWRDVCALCGAGV